MMSTMEFFGILDPLVTLILFFVAIILPVMQILHRAGYSRLWILIAAVPGINLIFFWIFAFARWPIEDQLEALKNAVKPQAASTP